MTLLFIIAVIIAGIFYFLWQEEREKLAKAEKEIKQLKKRKQSSQSSQSRQSTRAPQPPEKRTDPVTSTNEDHIELLQKLFTKEIWSRSEILELVGPNVMIGNLLERINDYSCSKIDDVVVEEDGDNIYVTTQYKNLLI